MEYLMADTYKGKSLAPGGGGRFERLKDSIAAKGGARDAGAIAAAIGRRKYGSAKMAKFSAEGRKRG